MQSPLTIALASVVLTVLGLLSAVRLRALIALWQRDRERYRAAFPSWAASVYGFLAIIAMGLVIPLAALDRLLGGVNVTNLLQSTLAVLAFWYFRDAVWEIVRPDKKRRPKWVLLGCITAFAIPFFLITDRAPTSTRFMAMHVDQVAAVAYNFVYFATLAWIVADMIWALKKWVQPVNLLFTLGLSLVLLSTVDQVVYYITAHFEVTDHSTFLEASFFVLFFGGILVVAAGWLLILWTEREYLARIRLRALSFQLALLLLRLREEVRDCRPTSARVPYSAQTISAIRVLGITPLSSVMMDLVGADAHETAYRLVIQIRNFLTVHNIELSSEESSLLERVESTFPGVGPILTSDESKALPPIA